MLVGFLPGHLFTHSGSCLGLRLRGVTPKDAAAAGSAAANEPSITEQPKVRKLQCADCLDGTQQML